MILSGAVVGRLQEKLKIEIRQTQQLNQQLRAAYKNVQNPRAATMLGLAKLAEYRDNDTGAHLERIREYCKVLANELSKKEKFLGYITAEYVEDLYLSSILHDIGKVGVPDSILLKPGELTPEEYAEVKRHTILGGDALRAVESQIEGRSFLALGKEIAYHHQEKWDGTGYPKGLKGEEIPLSARIVALADAYDALTSERVYKESVTHQQSVDIIAGKRAMHFDPDVVDAFLAHVDDFDRIRAEMQDQPPPAPPKSPSVAVS